MPLGGASILWNEATPAESDIADAAPIRSIETSIRNAMGSEHNWPATGGANVGYHLLGSARAFYDVQSNVSSSGTDGRLLVTSDSSRLFHVGSGGTMLLGGQNVLSIGSAPVGGQRFYWVEEFGVVGTATGTVTIPNSGYSGAPFVYLSYWTDNAAPLSPQLNTVTATNFTFAVRNTSGSVSVCTTFWRSIGTRTF